MRFYANKKTALLLTSLLAVMMVSGCTNWEKKYQDLNVEYQNCKGLLESARGEKTQLADEISRRQQTIEELQQKIQEQEQSAGQATGFGDEYDVSLDAQAGTITVTLPNKILFRAGEASLKSATNVDLDHIVSVLNNNYAGKQIDVIGHTDSDPIQKSDWDDNWELSTQRALSVVRYLIDHGINEDQIRAVGRGDTQPIASNSTASGKTRNRRVEIVVNMRS